MSIMAIEPLTHHLSVAHYTHIAITTGIAQVLKFRVELTNYLLIYIVFN